MALILSGDVSGVKTDEQETVIGHGQYGGNSRNNKLPGPKMKKQE